MATMPPILDGKIVCNQCKQPMRPKKMSDEFNNSKSGNVLFEMLILFVGDVIVKLGFTESNKKLNAPEALFPGALPPKSQALTFIL